MSEITVYEAGMTNSPKPIKYYVQVARFRLETAIIAVEGGDDSDAEQKAIERAQLLADPEWQLQPFNYDDYLPHVEAMIAEDDLPESEGIKDALFRSEARYLLLKGDCETGEGDLILQPWFETEQPDLLACDLCAEWIGALDQLGLTYLSERVDDLLSGSQPTTSDRILLGGRSKKQRDTEI